MIFSLLHVLCLSDQHGAMIAVALVLLPAVVGVDRGSHIDDIAMLDLISEVFLRNIFTAICNNIPK